jgi:hypothetical protein
MRQSGKMRMRHRSDFLIQSKTKEKNIESGRNCYGERAMI